MNVSKELADLRREYSLRSLSKSTVKRDPFDQFIVWMNEALAAKIADPTAMMLATVDSECRPSARIVLLKNFDKSGFVFFTNYESKKGGDLLANPNAVLNFFWPDLERQLIISGKAQKTSQEESERYFSTRPHESKIGAWASRQSEVIESRSVLEKRFDHLLAEYPDGDVPLPPFWGGFRLVPSSFEFWQGRPNRLHDRLCYELTLGSWSIFRRSP